MRVRLAGRVGDAPVDQLRMAGELRADLANPVAQRDHVAEPLPGELLQVLGPVPADVDAVLAHHPHRLRVQWLGTAARPGHLDRASGQLPEQRLGHLRATTVPGASEQHPSPHPVGPGGLALQLGPGTEPRMKGQPGLGQPLAAAGQLDAVVGVPAVGRTAARRHQAARAELAQVVGDQALRLAQPPRQLADLAIGAGQLGQQPPAQRMAGQPQEPRRSALHTGTIDQTSLINQYRPGRPG